MTNEYEKKIDERIFAAQEKRVEWAWRETVVELLFSIASGDKMNSAMRERVEGFRIDLKLLREAGKGKF